MNRIHYRTVASLFAIACAIHAAAPHVASAGIFGLWGFHPPAQSPVEDEDAEDSREIEGAGRSTLFQWNPAAPVIGGPKIDEPLVSDRPDFTEASVTVGYGVTQLEMGYTFTLDRNNGTHSQQQSYPELLLRQGLFADWFELRLEWGFNDEFLHLVPNTNVDGNDSADLGVGCKLALTPQDEWRPETAMIINLTLPTGPGSHFVLPGVSYLYGWDLDDTWSLGGSTLGEMAVDDDGGQYLEVGQSLTLGCSLTEKVGSYAEWFALLPAGAQTELPQHYINGGLTFLVNNNLQFDVRAGAGLNAAADNFFTGAGAVIRR